MPFHTVISVTGGRMSEATSQQLTKLHFLTNVYLANIQVIQMKTGKIA
jgi:hypothetical protein